MIMMNHIDGDIITASIGSAAAHIVPEELASAFFHLVTLVSRQGSQIQEVVEEHSSPPKQLLSLLAAICICLD